MTVWPSTPPTQSSSRVLRRVVRSTQRITWDKLPSLQDTYTTWCHRKAKKIKDNNHPSHCLFTSLSSRRQGQYMCIKAGTERLENSFYLKAIRLLNRNLQLREAAYIETQSLSTLINGTPVTLNNATLIMFTYYTFLISHVYTVFYTICCTLPMLLSHHSSIYLYVHILIHPFRFVCIR